MEQVQTPDMLVAGDNPVATPLEQKHNDIDILKGCPRSIKVGNFEITQRAFYNSEYSTLSQFILVLGILSVCKTPEEVDLITVEDIYNNITFQTMHFGQDARVGSLEEFLYKLMHFPDGVNKPPFTDVEITKDDFMNFLAVVVEQNNMLKYARLHAKKNLELINQMSRLMP